ncbi:ABC-type multidrug transport system, ATPase component [Streptomyces sp. WMMB 714]|jgi:ABC-2 type transport system ATP-binding protein|uniref:ATP-binding cassette domain-containing protein n=1 Tax=Streptomyces sp. WMMB 714 TaxID=1286822 RepID=UPI0005F7CA74|nr:ATP-binding cassette domain-containing protein [Streptomyces sp. WMMB 714]SCK43335.1 ABC-type multidrug transport system, ATPase component [Streptomyces sp. WMMB 714]
MRLDGVGRRYGWRGDWVLREVDLSLPERSLVRFEGDNGSGKSTLLRMLAGVETPTEGQITGRPSCGYVPERFPAAMPLTTRGYLTHLGRVHGLSRTVAVRRAGEWLERFGAAGHSDTPLSELSKGTSQKVAVTQALMARPGLLVLDEAWTGLDHDARTVLDHAVAERVAEGATVVFVDHDPGRLAGASDATYRIEGGRLRPVAEKDGPRRPGRAAGGGKRVRVVAEGPPGQPPPALPASVIAEQLPGGTIILTAPVAYSDVLLGSLLEQNWYIRSVREESA